MSERVISKGALSPLAKLALCSLLLGLVSPNCVLDGCSPEKCQEVQNSNNICLECNSGYYKTVPYETCNKCYERCTACTDKTVCTACKDGYFLDSQQFCSSCPANCLTCESEKKCLTCSEGVELNTEGMCGEETASQEEKTEEKSKNSMVGQIIGYCVSALVVVFCCALTLAHQKRKEEEQEKARKAYREEQIREQRRQRALDEGNYNDIVEDPDFEEKEGVNTPSNREKHQRDSIEPISMFTKPKIKFPDASPKNLNLPRGSLLVKQIKKVGTENNPSFGPLLTPAMEDYTPSKSRPSLVSPSNNLRNMIKNNPSKVSTENDSKLKDLNLSTPKLKEAKESKESKESKDHSQPRASKNPHLINVSPPPSALPIPCSSPSKINPDGGIVFKRNKKDKHQDKEEKKKEEDI